MFTSSKEIMMIILVDPFSPSPIIPQIVDNERRFGQLETFSVYCRTLLGKYRHCFYSLGLLYVREVMNSVYNMVRLCQTQHHPHLDMRQYQTDRGSDEQKLVLRDDLNCGITQNINIQPHKDLHQHRVKLWGKLGNCLVLSWLAFQLEEHEVNNLFN